MLAPRYVGGELVTVPASVAAHVALQRVSEAMAAHVDGEHDVVQEDDLAVAAGVHGSRHGARLAVRTHHPQSLQWRQRDVLRVGVWDAIGSVGPSQQVPQAVHEGRSHLGALGVEGVHAEGWLREAHQWKADLVAIGEAYGADVGAV